MKRLIICEGKTDAILVGYFLARVYGWTFSRDPKLPSLPFDKLNESLCWFSHPQKLRSEVAVWGAGGITQIPEKLRNAVERTKSEPTAANRFDRFVLLIDRDDKSAAEVEQMLRDWIQHASIALQEPLEIGAWARGRIDLSKTPAENHQFQILPIVLPPTQEGCLEVFLAEALRTVSAIDLAIVDRCRNFVASIPDEPYLTKSRFRSKAIIGATLSVMSPDWVFGDLDEKLNAIHWEQIQMAHEAYQRLGDL